MPPHPVSVLLVGPHAEAWADAVAPDLAYVTPTASAAAARTYLGGTTFDAVFVEEEGGADALRLLRDVPGLAAPVQPVGSLEDVLRWVRGDGPAGPSGGADTGELLALRQELSRVAHALNNPLAVIAGNAQLGLELAAALGADEGVVETLENIREAAARLEGLFSEVGALRARVDRIVSGS